MPVDVIARHHGKGEKTAAQNSKVGDLIAPPHNVSIARHGCAHMRWSGGQPCRSALLVARQLRDIERSRRETARPIPLHIYAHDWLREMFAGRERLFLHGLLRTFSSPWLP
jgi:hypothetical protein